MRRLSTALATLTCLASTSSCTRSWQTPRCPTEALPHDRVIAGWHALFDGRSVEAWREVRGWEIDGDTLRSTLSATRLETKRRYRNFELEFEWRSDERTHTGVAVDDGDRSFECSLTAHDNSWNTVRIQRIGDTVVQRENDLAALTYKTDVQRGSIHMLPGTTSTSYRRILIRELPPEEARHGQAIVLFGGRDLDPWDSHLRAEKIGDRMASPADVWSINGEGLLVCRGEPWGYLYTKERHDNYILRVTWRFDPVTRMAGNSGVLLRMTGEHKVWPRSIEAQLKSGFAGDFWNIGQFPMQVVAARTYGRNTRKTHGNERRVGAWNDYEIIVDGPWVQLRVNGDVVNEAWDCETTAGHICLQSEGAEIHFKRVELVPLR